jgi:hypothetical protein
MSPREDFAHAGNRTPLSQPVATPTEVFHLLLLMYMLYNQVSRILRKPQENASNPRGGPDDRSKHAAAAGDFRGFPQTSDRSNRNVNVIKSQINVI